MKLKNLLLLLPAILALSFVTQAQGPLSPYQVTQLRTKPVTEKADSMYVPVVAANGTIAQKIRVGDLPTYKVYTALLTQSGTSAPTATVLQNNLGAIVWSYVNVGTYRATLTGVFLEAKTWYMVQDNLEPDNTLRVVRISNNVIEFTSQAHEASALGNNMYNFTPIEIRVYK